MSWRGRALNSLRRHLPRLTRKRTIQKAFLQVQGRRQLCFNCIFHHGASILRMKPPYIVTAGDENDSSCSLAEYQQQQECLVIQTRRLTGNPACKGNPWLSRPGGHKRHGDGNETMEPTRLHGLQRNYDTCGATGAAVAKKRALSFSDGVKESRKVVTISATKPATYGHLVSDNSELPKQQGQQPVVYCTKKLCSDAEVLARRCDKTWISLQTFQAWCPD